MKKICLNATASVTAHASYTGSWSSSETNTNTEESNWNNQITRNVGNSKTKSNSNSESSSHTIGIGRSKASTSSLSSSSTQDNRVSDAISVGRERATSNVISKSNSKSNTETLSDSYRIDDSYQSSDETSIGSTFSDNIENSKSTTKTQSREITHTTSLANDITFPIPPGTCKIAVCLPFVKAIAIPFLCINEKDGSNELIYVDYMVVEPVTNKSVTCTYRMIDCELRHSQDLFIIDNKEFKNAFDENSMDFGESRHTGLILVSENDKFSLILNKDGNLQIKQYGLVVWDNGMGLFKGSNYTFRLRINEKGHLVEEAKGLFTNTVPGYRSDEWITVWSSAPINHNVTIGIPELPGQFISYKLILENTGQLSLYDAVGTSIWCASNDKCNHRFGYKFPEVYLVPTNFITPADNDKHNRIDDHVILMPPRNSTLVLKSLDVNCERLEQNVGFQSPNGRFKLILEESGNLVIKDGSRTMWESTSGYLPFTEPPYKLILTPTGSLLILDAKRFVVWFSRNQNSTGPHELRLLNEGKLVIKDATDNILWESWPLRDMSSGITLFKKIIYTYCDCDGYVKEVLISDNEKNQLWNNYYLQSPNKRWRFGIMNRSIVGFQLDSVLKSTWFEMKELNYLNFTDTGRLVVYNERNETKWSDKLMIDDSTGPYKLILNNHCALKMFDRNSKLVWTKKPTTKELFEDYFNKTKIYFNWTVIDEFNMIVSTLNGHVNSVNGLGILKNGDLVSSSDDQTIRIWNTTGGTNKEILKIQIKIGWIKKLIVLHNQDIASLHDDNLILIWDSTSHALKYNITSYNAINALVSLSNTEMAFASGETIIIWQLRNNIGQKAELKNHTDKVTSLCLLRDGYLASGSLDETINIWHIADRRLVKTLVGHRGAVVSLVSLPNALLASGSVDTQIIIWDLKHGKLIETLKHHNKSVTSLVLISNVYFASASHDKTIAIWNLKSDNTADRLESILTGHKDSVKSLAVLSNGDLASGSDDNTIRIWRRLLQ